ncbi:MAG: CopG family transcriptional regulator [Thermodesulfobacteriota bacterium]
MDTLKRKQIYIDEESDRALKSLASSTKTSESEHIRKAIKDYLAKKGVTRPQKDPLLKVIGLCDNPVGPNDASIHHDKYLYGKEN